VTHGAPLYPVSLSVAGVPCLVVGGGSVGLRKVSGLLRCAASVTVIAPAVHPSIEAMAEAGALQLLRRPYRDGDHEGFRLVFTATGVDTLDGAIAQAATRAGIWVNSADDVERSSFVLPSVHREGPVSVAVSTSGTSPALAIWLRRRVAAAIGPDVGLLAEGLAELRRGLKARGVSTEAIPWQRLLDGELPALVGSGRMDEARVLVEASLLPEP
jgi:precorrin-2 dehydrogenase / sirohydrochlorin ferrochelatase